MKRLKVYLTIREFTLVERKQSGHVPQKREVAAGVGVGSGVFDDALLNLVRREVGRVRDRP